MEAPAPDRMVAPRSPLAADPVWQQVVRSTPNAILLVDRRGRIVLANPLAESLFGYAAGQLVDMPVNRLVPATLRERHPALHESFFEKPISRPMGAGRDLLAARADGTEFPVEIGLNPVETAEGAMVMAVIVDISARKRLERQLIETTELLRATLDAAPFPIMVTDPGGTVLMWNRAGEQTLGYPAAEIIGRSFMTIVPPGDEAMANEMFHDSADKALARGARISPRRKDGRRLAVNVFNAPILFSDGTIRAVVSTFEDVTHRELVEGQLRQAQKMEAIGSLTGGMAHDFNNLLSVIMGNLDVLQAIRSDDAEVTELAQEALDAANRGADLTRRLLAFARRQPLQPRLIDLNALIQGIAKLLSRLLRENVTIVLRLDPDVWQVTADAAQLETALANLATNARDAMPRGGRLTVVTGNRVLDGDYIATNPDVVPGEYALVEVTDTGTGMPAEVVAHIFEPFFTTKERDKGTGLGLSMVFGFVKQSGGHIAVYSEVGVGTTFRIYLPRAEARQPGAEDGSVPAEPVGAARDRTILVVEDNPALRKVASRQITDLGYRVRVAEGPAEALAALEEGGIDLLFTDVIMPGSTNGYELARVTAQRWPTVKVLLTSGFPEPKVGDVAVSSDFRLLGKPYRRVDLARLLAEILD